MDSTRPIRALMRGLDALTFLNSQDGATVSDIAAARSYLEGAGVRFDGETRQVEDMVRLATFYDPDGNAIMLAQQLK